MTTTARDAARGTFSKATPHKCKCPDCGKFHFVDKSTFFMFGADCYCLPCTDDAHVKFMATTGRKLKMTCVKGCRCGFGK